MNVETWHTMRNRKKWKNEKNEKLAQCCGDVGL